MPEWEERHGLNRAQIRFILDISSLEVVTPPFRSLSSRAASPGIENSQEWFVEES